MPNPFGRAGNGQFADPRDLPAQQRRLHERHMKAIREQRARELAAATEEQARWPGLVDVDEE